MELAALEGQSIRASENSAADDPEATVSVIWGPVNSPATEAVVAAPLFRRIAVRRILKSAMARGIEETLDAAGCWRQSTARTAA